MSVATTVCAVHLLLVAMSLIVSFIVNCLLTLPFPPVHDGDGVPSQWKPKGPSAGVE